MRVFLIKKEQEKDYTIMKVKDEDILSFRKEYGDKILLEADSIQQLLITFGEAKKQMK
ncbi:hypothetical protein [Terrimonas pollutisoli]|uniref:hypothetical protein n=1 Tax=Terrimonas pollutisoli TaxID=3034147 RepID=UPI0023EB3E27|nr:hypothetical protein [Terrimonas sp. H1YJ31]